VVLNGREAVATNRPALQLALRQRTRKVAISEEFRTRYMVFRVGKSVRCDCGCLEETTMKRLKCALALAALLVGALVPDVASADRGRGPDSLQVFKYRHDASRSRHDFDRPRGGAFRHSRDAFRHGGRDAFRHGDRDVFRHGGRDVFRHGGRDVFRHGRRDAFRHGDHLAPVRRGHGGHHRHGHTSLGLHIGVPLFWNSPPYYAYPPTVIAVPSQPQVYIERGYEEPAPAREQGYWYYCDSPSGYYPYVRECPGGWERVAPTPPR
jgi:hypothetical protein